MTTTTPSTATPTNSTTPVVNAAPAPPVAGVDAAPPRISVIGTGYLGATHAAAMAELGFDVIGVDTDAARLTALAAGHAPFYEPGLPELLRRHKESGRLRFVTDIAEAVASSDVHFICVGTPQSTEGGSADLTAVEAATRAVAAHLRQDAVIVGKSTVPVGTAARLRQIVRESTPDGIRGELVWNPEFLREGRAVVDSLRPDRLVFGGASTSAEATLRTVYAAPIADGTPVVLTDLQTAELVKTSANAFLATKISFINAIAELCEIAGADVSVLSEALGIDVRIGRQFLSAGLGFGGGCLPKDIRALRHRALELGASSIPALLDAVDDINLARRRRTVELAEEALGGSVSGRRIAALGLAFKPDTDDIRDSPALAVVRELHRLGADVVATDPRAVASTRSQHADLQLADTAHDAVAGSDLTLLLTEWPEYVTADPQALAALAERPVVIDARLALPVGLWRQAGWRVVDSGRSHRA